MNDNYFLQARSYAERGWRVFPIHTIIDGICSCGNCNCDSPAKHPLNYNGCNGATTEPELIKEWHEETQEQFRQEGHLEASCNWGLATGPDTGVWVLDVDPRHGGDKSLAHLEEKYGPLPLTPTIMTGGGGKHFYFTFPPGVRIPSRSGILPGIDIRGENGYVVAVPSLHASGKRYECVTPMDTPLAEAPVWLLALVLGKQDMPQLDAECLLPASRAEGMGISKGVPQSVGAGLTLTVGMGTPDLSNSPGVGEGSRNATLCKLAGVHIARGESREQVEALALAWARRCNPPFPETKALDTVRRLERKHGASTEIPISGNANPVGMGREGNNPGTNPKAAAGGGRISSLPPFVESPGDGGVGLLSVKPEWPTLHADAYHGLPGQIVKSLAPETEADSMGVLLSLLTGFGNAVGHSPRFHAGGVHHANLFAVLVGKTSGAKGMAVSDGLLPVQKADPQWAENCIGYGLGSGEGLVERVRDAQAETESMSEGDGNITGFKTSEVDAGAPDKRLLIVEEEFAKVVTLLRRENSTLSQHAKNAWDGKPLEVLNRGKNKLKATEHHVGILATITPDELAHCFAKGTATKDGFANRFVWSLVMRSKSLPHGGNRSVLERFVKPLAEALTKAKTVGEMKRSEPANRLWEVHYERLVEAGDKVTACERARPQVLRMSMVYALLDASATIQVEHLSAALAVWDYCEASARLIFSAGLSQTNTIIQQQEPLAVRLFNAITNTPRISRSGLREVAGHKVRAEEIEQALAWIEAQGHAHRSECGDGPGRRAECWCPGPKQPQVLNAENKLHDVRSPLRGEGASPGSDVSLEPDPESRGREGGNSSTCKTPEPEPIASLPPPTPNAIVNNLEQFAPSLPRSLEQEQKPNALVSFLPPSPLSDATANTEAPANSLPPSLSELFARVKAQGGRLVRSGGVVSVEAEGVTPEMQASVQAHQSDLLLLVPEPDPDAQGERWQFYYSKAIDANGKNRDWAERYATAQVKREREEAERMQDAEPPPPDWDGLAELRAMKP